MAYRIQKTDALWQLLKKILRLLELVEGEGSSGSCFMIIDIVVQHSENEAARDARHGIVSSLP